MTDLNVTFTSAGPTKLTYTELRDELVTNATAIAPGLTTELPGSLIEDMSSTGTGALLSMDAMRMEVLNGIGPLSANIAMLTLLAQQYGVSPQKTAGSTTVLVTFTGTPQLKIPLGFIVTDGTYQYATSAAAVIPSSGSVAVTCTAVITGTWAVPIGTVTTTVTAVANGATLTCTNLVAGVAGSDSESDQTFRARVWEAGMVTVQGVGAMIRTLVNNVDNVDSRLTSAVVNGTAWSVMCGGGDNSAMALAIMEGVGDITRLVGSTLNVTGISNANPGVVTTDLTHGFTSGQVIQIEGAEGLTALNGVDLTITVLTPHTFSVGVNTTSSGTWTSGGIVTPNLRNQSVVINDFPDTYTIPFITPLQQVVTITFEWGIDSSTALTDAAINTLINDDILAYVNAINAGKPLNIGKLRDIFMQDINTVLDMSLLTTLDIVVTVNGTQTEVDSGTQIISGDKFSYWYIESTGVIVSEA